jgi:5-methylcytosine-specific restriction endonuclease McrA
MKKTRAQVKAKKDEWKMNNHDKVLASQKRTRERVKNDPERRAHRNEMMRGAGKRLRVREKLTAIARYGGKCAYCGEDRFELLTIDHINDDGGEHRRQLGLTKSPWSILAYKEIDIDRYQILCMNCNMAKASFGIRPGGNDYKPKSEWIEFATIRHIQKDKYNSIVKDK